MKQQISFTGANDTDVNLVFRPNDDEDEQLTLKIDGETVLYLSHKNARALAKFLDYVTS